MRIALAIVGVIAGLIGLAAVVLYLLGRAQPERHAARVEFTVRGPREAAWAALTDYAAMPQWWPAVKQVRFETRGGDRLTVNTDAHGREVAFRTREERAPARLVREIVGDQLPFGGTWTFELAAAGDGTRITVTEDGFIGPPIFRAVARYFIGLDATLQDFAQHFQQHLGTK